MKSGILLVSYYFVLSSWENIDGENIGKEKNAASILSWIFSFFFYLFSAFPK